MVLVALCAAGLSVWAQGVSAATASLSPNFGVTGSVTCGGTATATVTLAAQDPPAVRRPQDIMFVLDESGSIASQDFARMKQSVQGWALSGQVFGPTAVGAGVVQFSGDARLTIPMTYVQSSFANSVGNLYQRGGSTDITDGLRLGQQELLNRGRANVQDIYILETDGVANVNTSTLIATANAIKSTGGLIFSIGVGAVDANQLTSIASSIPGVQTVYTLADYTTLEATLNTISTVLNPAATNVSYGVTPAAGWEVTGATATRGTVSSSASGLTWSASELRTGQTTITYTLHQTGSANGAQAPQSSATLSWKDDAGVAQSASYAGETVTVTGCNAPPVANAGPDATAQLSGSRTASVTLDGRGSTDDGRVQPLSYTWSENGTELGTGSTLTTALGLGVHDVTLTVGDGEYTATDSVTITVSDPTAPVVTPVATGTLGNGWYRSDVALSWTATDPESDVTSAPCAPASVVADTAGDSFTCEATSAGGTTSVTTTIKRDATKPVVAFSGNQGTYALTDTVAITCSASDALSGLAGSTCPEVSGPAYTFAGGKTLNASATDVAGNVGTASTSFTVDVTIAGICALTSDFVEGSAKYQKLPAQARAAGQKLATGACKAAAAIGPKLSAKQKAVLVKVFDVQVDAMVKPGWLTQAQANTLRALAAEL
jgi:uncharacterized protein YegL